MARASSKIKAGELKSLLRAVADAGVKITRIDIGHNGSIAMLTSDAKEGVTGVDDLDRELAEFVGRDGHS